MTKLVRGSNTGVFMNGNFFSTYQEACPRIVTLRSMGVQPTEQDGAANPVFALGYAFESYIKSTIGCDYEEEKLIEIEITPELKFQGHSDAVLDNLVLEFKSCSSKNTYREVFIKEQPKLSNLFQLCAYMLGAEINHGKLIYGSYLELFDYNELKLMTVEDVAESIKDFVPELKVFDIDFSEDGEIYIDGKRSIYNITHIYDFWLEIARYQQSGELPPKPVALKGSPCFFCPLKLACSNTYENMDNFKTYLLTSGLCSEKVLLP
jgi:CRISPR/Cas system-associated exonuclease Cas4 (RecB family)